MQILSPSNWPDYELIDSGDFEKLERFDKYILRRPEPKAVWSKSLSLKEWSALAHAEFCTGAGFGKSGKEDSGSWTCKKNMLDHWFITYAYKNMRFQFQLALTSFKHVGVFPEQASNWNYIYDSIHELQITKPRILNLFAYTGGASLAACAAGADVTHLDSVKQVVSWANRNREASKLNDIRWVVDDALKFVQREAKRGKTYHGILLDPPAYGHGTNGEKWKLEQHILEMMQLCKAILLPQQSFMVLNLYSNGFSAVVADTLVSSLFPICKKKTYGELVLTDRYAKRLPLSVFSRFNF